MAKSFQIKQIEQNFKRVLQYAPGLLANDAVNFFLDSFKRSAWLGNTIEPWQKRKPQTMWGKTPRNQGRALLIDTGRLRRSIRVVHVTNLTATIGTDVPYAKAHNEGLRLGIIQQVKQHTRRATRLGITSKRTLKTRSKVTYGRVYTGGSITVKAHTRRINMKLPRRQFMGNSPYLQRQLTRRLQAELLKGLRR
jgi:phage gpG-like protein